MPIYRQNDDGTWSKAVCCVPRIVRFEHWLRRRGWYRLADLVVRWDERKLGR